YNEAISKEYFSKLCISHIKNEFSGDTFFPKIDLKNYKKIIEKDFKEFIYCEYENLLSKK
ncbi:dihydrofolate reductase, partial [Fusobacterium sp.]|uniref:dihydrofolate reductase n=1 Tax=Fusobacterium sp. TaxID=68766 RepID=UPI00261E5E18